MLRIDRETGIMRSARRFDRETLDGFSVVVVARDAGTPSLSASATISVTVTDVNDHAPVFSQPEYTSR